MGCITYFLFISFGRCIIDRIYLSALKEVPQYALKNHVYFVPDAVPIHPVAYQLPKRESYMRRDVLR